jgi:hypothetical protein
MRPLIFYRLGGTIILDISHGYEVKDTNDKFVRLAEETVAELTRVAVLGKFLVDAIPARQFYDSNFRSLLKPSFS